ncbi:MAG TPA: AAA family ATPase [Verrucomicrobiae bacterium]|jgi:predicted ATPase
MSSKIVIRFPFAHPTFFHYCQRTTQVFEGIKERAMIVTRLILKNWRNFRTVDVNLGDRVFLVGPNAAGKSNFLEVFRFLRDITKSEGGGLQNAVAEAGGLKKIRCLGARGKTDVEIEVYLSDTDDRSTFWRYAIGLNQDTDKTKPHLVYERVFRNEDQILNRPEDNDEDKKDPERLTQTHLESTFANQRFRQVGKFFERVSYVHLVPQLVRHPERFVASKVTGEPFGLSFMEQLAKTQKGERTQFLKRIEKALRIAVPQFKNLKYVEEQNGQPHLQVIYEHWRPQGARQQEDQFSDGTIRFIGLFWALLESSGLMLLEEPELSLNSEIVRQIPALMYKFAGKLGKQVMVSTHSAALLADAGIGLEEVLLLIPHTEGTDVRRANSFREAMELVEKGMKVGDAVLPLVNPQQMDLIEM